MHQFSNYVSFYHHNCGDVMTTISPLYVIICTKAILETSNTKVATLYYAFCVLKGANCLLTRRMPTYIFVKCGHNELILYSYKNLQHWPEWIRRPRRNYYVQVCLLPVQHVPVQK